jgi:hypothetical protein
MTTTRIDPPAAFTAELQRLARTELSRPARFGHVLLLLASAGMTAVVVSLWLTEPVLPARTTAAFAMMTLIGLGWMGFATWVLRTKHVLLVRQRLAAGRMAVTFSAVGVAGATAVAVSTAQPAAWAASAMMAAMLAVAVLIWRRAATDVARLVARRQEIESRGLTWPQ